MIEKEFLTIDEQIQYLNNEKKITITDREELKDFLLHNNYYYFISSTKVYFYDHFIKDKGLMYTNQASRTSRDWIEHYNSEMFIQQELLRYILNLERRLNSLLSYHLSYLILNECLTKRTMNKIRLTINEGLPNRHQKIEKDYKDCWKYISKLTFGATVQIIKNLARRVDFLNRYDTLTEKQEQELEELTKLNKLVCCGYTTDELQTMVILRNNLAHSTPITLFLTSRTRVKSKKLSVIVFHKRYELLRKLNFDSTLLEEMSVRCRNYMKDRYSLKL